MNKATLIKKELLPNNFKLTFKNSESVQFLILHKNKKKIYEQLELNQEYFYTWKRGNKDYCFINPCSIKKNIEKTEHMIEQHSIIPQKSFFIQQLIKDLKLKDMTEEELFNKIEYLKYEFKTTKLKNNLEFTFKWIKEFIATLYLKHKQLEARINHNYTEQEQKEQEFLTEIGAMFLQDWIYYQNKRENKYK